MKWLFWLFFILICYYCHYYYYAHTQTPEKLSVTAIHSSWKTAVCYIGQSLELALFLSSFNMLRKIIWHCDVSLKHYNTIITHWIDGCIYIFFFVIFCISLPVPLGCGKWLWRIQGHFTQIERLWFLELCSLSIVTFCNWKFENKDKVTDSDRHFRKVEIQRRKQLVKRRGIREIFFFYIDQDILPDQIYKRTFFIIM